MLNDARIRDLLLDVGLEDQIIKADHSSAKRFVIKGGKAIPLPSSPKNLITNKAFSIRAKLRLLKEPFIKNPANLDSQSFADFVRHRLGAEMLDYAAGPFVNGIYAGDPEQLSFRLAFPRLHKLVTEHESILRGFIKARKLPADTNKLEQREIISFQKGMQSLPEAFLNNLQQAGCRILTGISNSSLESTADKKWSVSYSHLDSEHQEIYNQVVLTVPAHRLEAIHFPEGIKLTHTKAIYHPPVASLLLGYKRNQVKHPLDGFGMLASLPEKTDILGALFTSTLFPDNERAPKDHVAINVMLGGARNPEAANLSESEMIDTAHRELNKVLEIEGEPASHHLKVWKLAIPQVNLGHEKVLAELTHAETQNLGIHFAGNYRGGISVGDSLINGMKLGGSL